MATACNNARTRRWGTARSRRRSRPPSAITRCCTDGTSPSRATGAATNSHHLDLSCSGSTQGNVAADSITATMTSIRRWVRNAVTMERRLMPRRFASDTWATTGQTLPGTYLPSWLAENTATDSVMPRRWARSRGSGASPAGRAMSTSSTRHPSARRTPAPTARTVAIPNRAQPTNGNAWRTSDQLVTSAQPHASSNSATSDGRR